MNLVLWILAGAMFGSVANLVLGTRNRAGIALDVAIGISGVVACGWLLGALTGTAAFSPGEFSPATLVIALMGAAVLLTALQVYRGRRSTETATRPGNAPFELPILGRAINTQMRELT